MMRDCLLEPGPLILVVVNALVKFEVLVHVEHDAFGIFVEDNLEFVELF